MPGDHGTLALKKHGRPIAARTPFFSQPFSSGGDIVMPTPAFRRLAAPLAAALLCFSLLGCSGGSDSGNLDGTYHGVTGSPISIIIKEGKVTVQVANESKTLPYKIEGKKIIVPDPKEGDLVLTINDDGTLTSELGVLSKKSK
jgi:hypothetical protein